MKTVLLVAYHFPPQMGSSGLLRSLKFCHYLPETGWLPVVLSVHPRAYEWVDDGQLGEIPPEVTVLRTFALDTRRHLAVRGHYIGWMALPDRWVSWCLSAVPIGLSTLYRKRVDVILTTFPIVTAVLIGWILHTLTGKPWIVDFRDSMTEDAYPRDPLTRRVYRWIERQAVRRAERLIFTAPSTVRMYLKRYPWLRPEMCLLIPNGYDEEDFQGLVFPESGSSHVGRPIRLLHLGLLYPEERDPRPFFNALARLKREGQVNGGTLRIDLRASGCEGLYSQMIGEMAIEDMVRLLPALPYRQALQDGADADGLLLFQAACCDHQIPAKGYEYLRLGKPILALTTETGDTAALLKDVGGATIVDLADAEAIYRSLPLFLNSMRNGQLRLPDPQKVLRYSRETQAQELAACLAGLRS